MNFFDIMWKIGLMIVLFHFAIVLGNTSDLLIEEKERYTQAIQDIEQNHPRAYCQFFTDERAEYWSFNSVRLP